MYCPECGSKVVHDPDTDTYDCDNCGGCFDEDELLDTPEKEED